LPLLYYLSFFHSYKFNWTDMMSTCFTIKYLKNVMKNYFFFVFQFRVFLNVVTFLGKFSVWKFYFLKTNTYKNDEKSIECFLPNTVIFFSFFLDLAIFFFFQICIQFINSFFSTSFALNWKVFSVQRFEIHVFS